MDKHVQQEFWNAFAKSPFIMMNLEGSREHSEPMTAQLDRDAHHAIWFYTSKDNRIGSGGKAMGQVATKDHHVFACLKGQLTEETDRAVKEKHWDSRAKAWFPNGLDDPNVVMLRFDIEDAEVWTVDISGSGRIKLRTGEPITPEEAGEHAVGAV